MSHYVDSLIYQHWPGLKDVNPLVAQRREAIEEWERKVKACIGSLGMKKVKIEINNRVSGPFEVDSCGVVMIGDSKVLESELRMMGATIIKHHEPLVWSGEVKVAKIHIYGDTNVFGLELASNTFEAFSGKTFKAALTEVIE